MIVKRRVIFWKHRPGQQQSHKPGTAPSTVSARQLSNYVPLPSHNQSTPARGNIAQISRTRRIVIFPVVVRCFLSTPRTSTHQHHSQLVVVTLELRKLFTRVIWCHFCKSRICYYRLAIRKHSCKRGCPVHKLYLEF